MNCYICNKEITKIEMKTGKACGLKHGKDLVVAHVAHRGVAEESKRQKKLR